MLDIEHNFESVFLLIESGILLRPKPQIILPSNAPKQELGYFGAYNRTIHQFLRCFRVSSKLKQGSKSFPVNSNIYMIK